MSEYQYYEFRTIDRPLTQDEKTKLRALSTRAEITSTSFVNTYSYGDFRSSPEVLMDQYFDAFVYVANWGTRQLMFRIPRQFLDVDAASAYCDEEGLSLKVKAKNQHVVIEFASESEEGDGWIDGAEWMPSLISLRAELMRGDFRALYLGWLASVQANSFDDPPDDDALEPPVPPGLAKLSAPLKSLAEFLHIDDNLIEVAAAASVGMIPAEPSPAEMVPWIKGLSLTDKDAYLLRFLSEAGDTLLRAEMSKRFRDETTLKGKRAAPATNRRTVAQLLAAHESLLEEKTRKAAEKSAKDKARRDREHAEARTKYLDDLTSREPAVWKEVDDLIATKLPKSYDQAVRLLVDLRDLFARSGRAPEFETRFRELRGRHERKSTLIKRFDVNLFR